MIVGHYFRSENAKILTPKSRFVFYLYIEMSVQFGRKSPDRVSIGMEFYFNHICDFVLLSETVSKVQQHLSPHEGEIC
jgi:hypothetical protein